MQRSMIAILIAVLLGVSITPPVSKAQGCGNAPAPRLTLNQSAYVIQAGTGSLNVREQPSRDAGLVTTIPEGSEFLVLEGPTCAGDIHWWRVQWASVEGWIAEGVEDVYFVAPVEGDSDNGNETTDTIDIFSSPLPDATDGNCGTLPSRWDGTADGFTIAAGKTLIVPTYEGSTESTELSGNLWLIPNRYGDQRCHGGNIWWDMFQDYYGPMPETFNGEYVLDLYTFEPDAPVALDVPMTDPVISSPDVPLPTSAPDESLAAGDFAYFWSWSGEFDPMLITMPETYQGDVMPTLPVDLNTVRFVDDAGLNDAQLRLLAQNGFVVIPGGYKHFDQAYYGEAVWSATEGNADFITTDALLHGLSMAYENTLQHLETGSFYRYALNWINVSFNAALRQYEALKGTPQEEAARRAAVYYGVALRVIEPNLGEMGDATLNAAPEILSDIDTIAALVMEAENEDALPLFDDYREDFTQYKPRGYYTSSPLLSAYFRAMMWMGRITFRAKDVNETMAGVLALTALRDSEGLIEWGVMDETLAWLVGPVDDLSPTELLPLVEQHFGTGLDAAALADPANQTAYIEALKALPGPRVNSLPLPVGILEEELDEFTRGFRVFGQRFTFDAYIFQNMIYPAVGEMQHSRALPMGEDVAAVLGSDLAFVETDKAGATTYKNYTENVAKLRDEVNTIDAAGWAENLYGMWLHALQPLAAHNEAALPPMMLTDAWKYKDLNTLLGSLTELKHATLLYAEQATGGLGGGGEAPPVTSYSVVEPNPLVFARIAIIARLLPDGLRDKGLLDDANEGLQAAMSASSAVSHLAAQLAEYARRELAGEELTEDDYYWLQQNFGMSLWMVRFHVEEGNPNPPERMALISDVASNPSAQKAYYMATGDADLIYVVTNSPFGLQLTRGAVYSTYAFEGPLTDRIDDDQWRARVESGELPPRPSWTATYRAE
jgi:hypothetical protein